MGSGASIDTVSDEDLIKAANQIYIKSPSRFDFIISEARKVSTESKKDAEIGEGFEIELLSAINFVRQKPKEFVKSLEEHLLTFEDEFIFSFKLPNGDIQRIQTHEGKKAVVEAIDFFRQADEVKPISLSTLLTKAAVDHATDIGKSGSTSHTGKDGSTLSQRVKRYAFSSCIGENLDFGNSDPAKIIRSLVIDDGVPSRGHRKNIMNPEFLNCGAALHKHKDFGICCVIDFAGEIKDISQLVSTDCNVQTSKYLSEEFLKVLNSIPSNDNGASLRKELNPYLDSGAEIELQFRPSEKSASFLIKQGQAVSTLTVKWKEA